VLSMAYPQPADEFLAGPARQRQPRPLRGAGSALSALPGAPGMRAVAEAGPSSG
jgi:hypothetical protein